jgi:ABC-2 type transport system ATP-binding protein
VAVVADVSGVSVQVRGLGFSYRTTTVFDAVDLDLTRGTNFVVGVNGAGKTTLFRLILGDLRPARGAIEVIRRGDDRGIGYLPQTFGFPPRLTVAEFLTHVAWLHRVPRARRSTSVADALARVGLVDRADDRMGTLSGGMLRRAGIAQALVHQPSLVLLDEPTVGLDPRQRVELRELLGSLARDTTMVISTHLLEDVSVVGGHVVVLHDGRVRFTGTTAEMAARAGAGPGSDLDRAFLTLTGTVEGGRR